MVVKNPEDFGSLLHSTNRSPSHLQILMHQKIVTDGLTDGLLYVLMIDLTKDRSSSGLERTLVCRGGRENLIKRRYQLCLLLVLSVHTTTSLHEA